MLYFGLHRSHLEGTCQTPLKLTTSSPLNHFLLASLMRICTKQPAVSHRFMNPPCSCPARPVWISWIVIRRCVRWWRWGAAHKDARISGVGWRPERYPFDNISHPFQDMSTYGVPISSPPRYSFKCVHIFSMIPRFKHVHFSQAAPILPGFLPFQKLTLLEGSFHLVTL